MPLTKEAINTIRRELARLDETLPTTFHALADEKRYRTLALLSRHGNMCVSDVAEVLGVSVPAASYLLKQLELAGLIRRHRLGQRCSYQIRKQDPVVSVLVRMIMKGRDK